RAEAGSVQGLQGHVRWDGRAHARHAGGSDTVHSRDRRAVRARRRRARHHAGRRGHGRRVRDVARPQACTGRVMIDIYAPRIRLEFRLTGRDGKVVSSGSRDLSDPLYLTRAVLLATDPLRYEKNLLRDWLEREFAGRPTSRGAAID